ncbi:hypothetical protein CTAYLR_005039 [Chrysophaeum taylorii]|uniref:TACO1/YebC-like second and third domain-containing protein n=1 Tax=Chrysophaeum taylorii TaxID=2483200 RepID=A0AAD7XKE6_9STRA|nr:hypothetical protein CTAYLR_005039 [Chrysophaeum taylorii]
MSRACGGDRNNMALAASISRARERSVPKDTIEAAVQRGAKIRSDDASLSEVLYEGMLGGIGVIVEAMTDNRNRTAQEIRALFRKHGGALGASNSVAWSWTRAGHLRVDAGDRDAASLAAIDAGALEIDDTDEQHLHVYVEPSDLRGARDALDKAGFKSEADLIWRPSRRADVPDVSAFLEAIDALEHHEDVSAVYHDAADP